MTTLEKVIKQNREKYTKMIIDYFNESGGIKTEEPTMKVSYKGVTGELLKLELSRKEDVNTFPGVKTVREYTLEIADETDGHKHIFENVDVSEIKFIGATVTIA